MQGTRPRRNAIKVLWVDTAIRLKTNMPKPHIVDRRGSLVLLRNSFSAGIRRLAFLCNLSESIGLMVWMFCTRHYLMPFAIDVVNCFGARLVRTSFLFLQMMVQCVPPTSLRCHPQM